MQAAATMAHRDGWSGP